jgi:hypothetical protein
MENIQVTKEQQQEFNASQMMENLSKMKYTRTNYFQEKTHEFLEDVKEEQGLTGTFARKLVRKTIAGTVAYKPGELGSSEFASVPSRKERRALAKRLKIDFTPLYNGSEPVYVSLAPKA